MFMAAVASVVPKAQKPSFFSSPFNTLQREEPEETSLPRNNKQAYGKKGTLDSSALSQKTAGQQLSTQAKTLPEVRQFSDEEVWQNAMGKSKNQSVFVATPVDGEEDALFAKAMQGVEPVIGGGRQVAVGGNTQEKADITAAGLDLAALLSENFEFALSHNSDEYMEGFVVGTDPLVVGKLKAGSYSPEAHLDLHGQNSRQALDALMWFVKSGYQRNLRCVLIVTGRGKNSPDKISILRNQVQNWLTREPFKRVVQAFCTAQPCDGGPGAIYVLLRKFKKTHGKIIWERQPFTDDYYEL